MATLAQLYPLRGALHAGTPPGWGVQVPSPTSLGLLVDLDGDGYQFTGIRGPHRCQERSDRMLGKPAGLAPGSSLERVCPPHGCPGWGPMTGLVEGARRAPGAGDVGSPPASFDLTDRVIIVTGGSRGLGLAASHEFAARGARVVVASRNADACRDAAAQLTSDTGNEAFGIGCHIGKWDDCDRLIAETLTRFGRIDGLINNAGMSPRYGRLEDVTEELFDKVIAVNLRGAFRISVLAGRHMAEHDGGSIVNISSAAALAPSAGELPYAAAKAGLHCLTLGLARTFSPRVRVNTVLPGAFDTDIAKSWPEHIRDRVVAGVPAGRLGAPGELVGTLTYLISDASTYTTGASIVVDGGVTLR